MDPFPPAHRGSVSFFSVRVLEPTPQLLYVASQFIFAGDEEWWKYPPKSVANCNCLAKKYVRLASLVLRLLDQSGMEDLW